jgi:putative membrane protein
MSSEFDKRSSFKLGSLIAGLLGLGLAVWMLRSYGVRQVIEVLIRVGWSGTLIVCAFHLVQMLFSALGWRIITQPRAARLPLRSYIELRWIREGVNNLLPMAQIGGEVIAGRLMQRRGVPLPRAVAGTTADVLMEFKTQILFTALGLVLLVRYTGQSATSALMAKCLACASLLVVGLLIALRTGLAAAIERAVLSLGRSFGWAATAQIEGLHEAVLDCYRSAARLALAGASQLFSWMLGGLEVWLILHFFGHDVGLGPALIIESLGQASKAIGFAIPSAIGVQEGGYILVCTMLGLSPQIGLALSLMKRLREVIWGVPGLVLWKRAETESSTTVASLDALAGRDQ